ncbi:unnamed protein product [Spodoptera exigua]|nr:unnamed protein product [Spodoptera exigua]
MASDIVIIIVNS